MEKNNNEKNDLLLSKKKLGSSVIFGLVKDYSNPTHIPFKDKMVLTPTEKYRIYGKFPVRMAIDIILVILSTIQIIMINGPTSSYTRAVERFFYDIFLQNDDPYDVEYQRMKYLYTMDEIIDHVKKSRDGFFDLKNDSIGNVTLEQPENSITIPVTINYLINDDNEEKDSIEQYNITKNDLWIFNDTYSKLEIKNKLLRIKSFLINYQVRTFESYNFGDYYECFLWNIEQLFSFEKRYHFTVSLKIYYSSCEDFSGDGNFFIKGSHWIPALTVFFSLINFILTMRSISINYKYYMNFKYRYSKSYIEIERENKKPKKKTKWELLRDKDKNNII